MVFVKIFLPLILIVALFLLFRWAAKAWKKVDKEQKVGDIDQKIDDIKTQEKIYKKASKVDVKSVVEEKKYIDKIKSLDV